MMKLEWKIKWFIVFLNIIDSGSEFKGYINNNYAYKGYNSLFTNALLIEIIIIDFYYKLY